MRKRLLVFAVLCVFTVSVLFAAGCRPVTAPPAPKNTAVLTGIVTVPVASRQVQGQALAEATVRIINPQTGEVVATTTTDREGRYSVEVPPGGPYIVEASKGNLKVLDVSPVVEAGRSYDLGTADPTSTAIALIFQERVRRGENPANINLDAIPNTPGFGNLVNAVTNALEAGQDPTQVPAVTNLVNTIVSPPAGPTPAPTPAGPTPAPTPAEPTPAPTPAEPTGPTCVTLPPPVISAAKGATDSTGTDPTGTTWTFSVSNANAFPQGTTFTWNFGDGSSAQGASVQHTYEYNNFYTVTVTVTHPNQCAPKTAQQNVPAFPDVETRVYAVKDQNGNIYIESGGSEYIYLVFETYYPDMSKFSNDILVDALITVRSDSPLDLSSVPVWYHYETSATGLPPGETVTSGNLNTYKNSQPFTLDLGSGSLIVKWLSEISGYPGPVRPQINSQPPNRLDRYILKVPITGFSGEATVGYTVVAATNNNFSEPLATNNNFSEPLPWLVGWGTGTSITRSTYEFTFGDATGPFSKSDLLSSPLQNPTFTNPHVDVTLQAEQPYGNLGYSRVRVEVEVTPTQGGGTLQLWAKDTNNNWWNIVATGWGPSTGFTIGPDYSATTPVYVVADQPGDYTVTVKLIDLSSNAVITQTTRTIEVEDQS